MKQTIKRDLKIFGVLTKNYWGAVDVCVSIATAAVVGLAISESLAGTLRVTTIEPCCQNTSLSER